MMLTPLPVKAVNVYLSEADGPAAALALAACGAFAPRLDVDEQRLPQRPGARYQEAFRSAGQLFEKLESCLELRFDAPVDPQTAQIVSMDELERVQKELGELWQECARCEHEQRALDEEARSIAQLDDALAEFENLNVDFGLLHSGLRFLDVHFGTVDRADVPRLRQALGLIGYSVTEFKQSPDCSHVALAGLGGVESALHGVLRSASFRPLQLPEEFRDTPSALRAQLVERRQRLQQRRATLHHRLEEQRARFAPSLQRAGHQLQRAAPYARLADGLQGKGGLIRTSGWVPADRVEQLRRTLSARLGNRAVIETRDPSVDELDAVPTVLRYPRWLQPFASLVRGYGIPRYGEVDPTGLFALTFMLMFGMMFGDVGQGGLIALGGALIPRRWRAFRPFAIGAGLSSVAFGVLYGSVFGYEGILHPVWMSPLDDPMRMLGVALAWGIGFILLVSLISIRNRVAAGRLREALLDGKGVAGVLLYLGTLYAAWRWVEHGVFGVRERLLIALPLLLIAVELWRRTRAPFAERLLVVVLEAFENFMAFLANTLSFLRVAAFSLNHVALAIAVFTIARMMEGAGHWVTVVLGNLFILMVEGAIVAIQVLRLEYYEGFARFFSGDGVAFRPLGFASGGAPASGGQ